jgi:hypothetical protein
MSYDVLEMDYPILETVQSIPEMENDTSAHSGNGK